MDSSFKVSILLFQFVSNPFQVTFNKKLNTSNISFWGPFHDPSCMASRIVVGITFWWSQLHCWGCSTYCQIFEFIHLRQCIATVLFLKSVKHTIFPFIIDWKMAHLFKKNPLKKVVMLETFWLPFRRHLTTWITNFLHIN